MPSDRPPQVRRRTPSTGRPAPARTAARRRVAARPTVRDRTVRGGVRRSNGLPLVARLILAVAIVVLAGASILTLNGGLGGAVAGLGSSVGSVISAADATASPTDVVAAQLGIPTLDEPANPYTNQATVTLGGRLPGDSVGQAGYRLRVLDSVDGAAPVQVAEIEMPTTATFTIPGVPLSPGPNDLTATVVDATGAEGVASVPVRYVLDVDAPRVKLTTPEEGGTVATPTVEVAGKTQGRSAITITNAANGATASTTAASDGTFVASVKLDPGANELTVTAVDRAGNPGTATLTVTRTGDAMSVTLTASAYRFKTADLPKPLTLTLKVTDPAGAPIVGARATFSVSLPGIPVVTGEAVTDESGRATFETVVPAGATPGSGPVTAFITTEQWGTASPRTVITVE